MKAAVIVKPDPKSPADAVHIKTDWPDLSAPGPGQARVRTLCSALNHLDLWMARGMMGPDIRYPTVSGSDACGIVEAVGPGVEASWVGRQVILNAAIDLGDGPRPDAHATIDTPNFRLIGEHFPGTHAAAFLAPVANLAAVDGLDPVACAAFGLTHLTAYSMFRKAGVKPGQTILITGIGGGVALAALALARHLGCTTIVTSRSQAKLDAAKALGATHGVLDDGAGDWSKPVRDLTGKRGVDVAIDSSGKATHLKALKSLARGGTYATCGSTSGPDATTDLARIFWMQLRIVGSTMATNSEFHQVASWFRQRFLTPVVDKVFPADRVGDALRRLESAEQFGKVVIDWR
jgi:NADPH:quinone reductase-like Zn-dependent oxidoreductase